MKPRLGTNVRRHRYFETNFPLLVPSCAHGQQRELIGVYGASDGEHEPGFRHPGNRRGPRQGTLKEIREAMGMAWARKRSEITEAIQPDFTELIGYQLLAHLKAQAVA